MQLDTLMQRAAESDAAAEELFALLYGELHQLAEHTLRRDGGSLTLGTTTLLHEAYLKIAGRVELAFEDRARFFAYAARAMRSLVIDYARNRRTQKRGAHLEVTLDESLDQSLEGGNAGALALRDSDAMVRLGEAMQSLTTIDGSLVELVDLHFFGGFSFTEIATMRGVSERTVQRDWRKARMLLRGALDTSGN